MIVSAKKTSQNQTQQQGLSYGTDWYERTRELSKSKRTVREEIGEPSLMHA